MTRITTFVRVGPPASSIISDGILDIRKDAVYFDGSNTTNRILDVLEEKRPKIMLIDEIEAKLEGSWGYQGHNILTECNARNCENNTLITMHRIMWINDNRD